LRLAVLSATDVFRVVFANLPSRTLQSTLNNVSY
jgi:hypothetical protein